MTALSSTLTTLENKQIPILLNPKKRKKESRFEEEIGESDNWSRFIAWKSKEGLVPLTKHASYLVWCFGEPTVRNTNYSINPLATVFFNDTFS
jgi:hypothetical protein